jgi:shikimate dehydrogenase
MHRAALSALGLAGDYERHQVPRGRLAERFASLVADGLCGANLTAPLKIEALSLAERVEESAREAGAANTLYRDAGRWVAANTDGEGLLRALAELGFSPTGARVAWIGAGGATRTAGRALHQAGARLCLLVRDVGRASPLAESLGAEVLPLSREVLAPRLAEFDLLVQASPATWTKDGAAQLLGELPLEGLRAGARVCDMAYLPGGTALTQAATARGLLSQDGAPMLLHQGAAAFERFTGRAAPVEAMRRALEDSLRVALPG